MSGWIGFLSFRTFEELERLTLAYRSRHGLQDRRSPLTGRSAADNHLPCCYNYPAADLVDKLGDRRGTADAG